MEYVDNSISRKRDWEKGKEIHLNKLKDIKPISTEFHIGANYYNRKKILTKSKDLKERNHLEGLKGGNNRMLSQIYHAIVRKKKNGSSFVPGSLNISSRTSEVKRLNIENMKLARRIISQRPTYSVQRCREAYHKHQKLKKLRRKIHEC